MTRAPQRRPKSSYKRFAAEQPNERRQAAFTHWWLADHTHTETLCWIDDHAHYALSVTAHRVTDPIVLAEFRKAVAIQGVPASTLTDNGMVFTIPLSGGKGRRIDQAGVITLRLAGQLHRIGVGRTNTGTRVLVEMGPND